MSQPGKSEVVLETDTGNPQGAPSATDETRQEGQYAGFNTVEELIAAYQKATTQAPKQDEGDDSAADDDKSKGGPPKIDDGVEDEVSDALKAAGLNQDDFTQEFAETGTLSDESFQKLEKAGFPRAMVDVYLAGLRAQQESYNAAVYGPAGGEDAYMELLTWAKGNLSAEDKRAFNDAVSSGDPARAAMAVQALVAKRGTSGKMLAGKTTPNSEAVKPFRSLAEVTAAKNDPRYRRDPAYRKEVSERLRVSTFL